MSQNDETEKFMRQMPISELDLQSQTINPQWGMPELHDGLESQLIHRSKYRLLFGGKKVLSTPDGLLHYVKMDNLVQFENEPGVLYLPIPKSVMDALNEEEENMWAMMSFYTRDLRLANLTDPELNYCVHYLNLAGDFLKMGFRRAFLIALSRVATMVELSQSRKGFLRKRINTITTEKYEKPIEPEKKSILQRGSKQ